MFMMHSKLLGQFGVWLLLIQFASASYYIKLESDSPAVLDAPIVFTGKLLGQQPESEATFRWRFSDNASPGHYNESDSDSSVTERNYTIVYPANRYESGTYEMRLTIYEYFGYIYWREVGRQEITFKVTSELNGKLDVTQAGIKTETSDGTAIVSSVKETSLDVRFHDPSDYLKIATIHYFWFINTVNYGQTQKGQFTYNFTTPGIYNVEVTSMAYFNNNTGVSKIQDTSKTALAKMGEDRSSAVKLGIFHKTLVAKEPISGTDVIGEVMLKQGKLVDLNVKCNGSGDWSYCWSIKPKGYNITGNETCEDPQYLKAECDFSIIWYLRYSDTYNILVEISNDVSSHIQVIPVTVYDVAHTLPVSIVVIPVASSIVVIMIIMSGIALYAHYKKRLAIEIADFDFGTAEDEELQFKTFWERLRESFGNAFTSGHGSETDSQGGYGSIT